MASRPYSSEVEAKIEHCCRVRVKEYCQDLDSGSLCERLIEQILGSITIGVSIYVNVLGRWLQNVFRA